MTGGGGLVAAAPGTTCWADELMAIAGLGSNPGLEGVSAGLG